MSLVGQLLHSTQPRVELWFAEQSPRAEPQSHGGARGQWEGETSGVRSEVVWRSASLNTNPGAKGIMSLFPQISYKYKLVVRVPHYFKHMLMYTLYLTQVWNENKYIWCAVNTSVHIGQERAASILWKVMSPLDQGETPGSTWLNTVSPALCIFLPLGADSGLLLSDTSFEKVHFYFCLQTWCCLAK